MLFTLIFLKCRLNIVFLREFCIINANLCELYYSLRFLQYTEPLADQREDSLKVSEVM